MKVLYLTYDGLTDNLGQSQIIPYLLGVAEQHDIHIISCEKAEQYAKNSESVAQRLKQIGIVWHPLPYTKSPPVFSTLKDLWRVWSTAKKLESQVHFNAVHCRSYMASLVGLRMKKKLRVPFIFDMRGFWIEERVEGGIWNQSKFPYGMIYRYLKTKEKEMMEEADLVVSLTENAKKEILSWDLETPPHIHVIPCCADEEKFSHASVSTVETESWRQKFGLEKDMFVLGYLGSLGTWYLLDEMFQFFSRLKLRKPNAKFLLITPDKVDVQAACQKWRLNPSDIIVQSASRDEVPVLLSLVTLGILFYKQTYSRKATSPTKLGEMLFMGIPVVANTQLGDTDVLLETEKVGLLVHQFTEKEYDRALDQLPSLLKQDSEYQRAVAKKVFSLQQGVNKYLSIYSQVKKTRLLFLIDSLNHGGVEYSLLGLIPGLQRLGYEIEIAAIHPKFTLAPQFRALGVRVHLVHLLHRWNLPEGMLRLMLLCRKRRYDIVHSFVFFAPNYLGLIQRWIPARVTLAGFAGLEFDRDKFDTPWMKFRKKFRITLIKNRLSGILVPSRAVKEHYVQHVGRTDIDIVGYAVPESAFQILPQSKEILKSVGIDSDTFVFACPARLIPEKGHVFLLEAIAELKNQNLRFKTLLIGDGVLKDEIQKKIAELNLQENVILHSALAREELFKILKAVDVILLPSISEGYGLAAAEAMALGKPVLGSTVGGIPELIEDEVSGLLVPPKEVQALSKAMKRLLEDSALRTRLSEAARQRAQSQFSLDAVASKTHAYYEKMLTQKSLFPLSEYTQSLLRCPACKGELELSQAIHCVQCGMDYAILDSRPVLLDTNKSLFKVESLSPLKTKQRSFWKKYLPSLGKNFLGASNLLRFRKLLFLAATKPKVLIIGSGEVGEGINQILKDPEMEVIETDVKLGTRVHVVCDAHQIPFADSVFDGVIVQAVLEHVCDPEKCVSEIFRVLKPNGLVYSETPFMQQVHMGPYDFTRFTQLGHRRLFRHFEVLDDGPACGPGMTLAWSYYYFLLSFTSSVRTRKWIYWFSAFTAFWLKYLDYFLIKNKASSDAASCFYLLGSKSNKTLSDAELIPLYRGLQECPA